MEITKSSRGGKMNIAVSGRIDTRTAPELEEMVRSLDEITDLTFDFKDVQYISSAGLRVILIAQKTMNKQGSMTIRNVSSEIMEIFEVTGLSDLLNIK